MNELQIIQKKRNLFLDFAKAFAVILVVIGHCIQFGAGTNYLKEELFFDNIIFKYIYSFHMPLFMLISGYLFAFGIRKGAKDIIVNKTKSLIVPILAWATLPLAVFLITKDVTVFSVIKYYIANSIYSLWFLWAVFWCSLIVLVVNKLLNDKIFVYILIFVVSFFVPDIYHIDLYKFMFPYFVIGYMYKKYDLQEKLKAIYNSDCFICVIGIVFILLFCLFERDSYIYVSGHLIVGKDFVNQLFVDFYRYITGLTGSVFTLLLLIKIYNFCTQKKILKENNVILTIGKNTMGIYIISGFINTAILVKVGNFITYPNCLIIGVESVLVIVVSILLIRFIQQYKLLNQILLGAKG